MATVPAPPLRVPRYGLIVAARDASTEALDPDGNPRPFRFDAFGVRWTPNACTAVGPLAPCDVTTELTLEDDCSLLDDAVAQPIELWAGYRTSTFGATDQAAQERARTALAVTESYQLAGELWSGTIAQAEGTDTGYLAKTGATIITGPVGIPEAIGVLDAELGDCLNGARGMLHATPKALALMVAAQVVQRDGALWVTPMGNVVVADAGYPGTEPAGQSTAGQNEWLYATGWVDVRLGAVSVVADESTLDRRTNTIEVRAFRPAVAIYDPCCRLAVQLDPCSTPCAA